MSKDHRSRVAAGLMIAVLSLGSAQAHAADREIRYSCDRQLELVIRRDGTTAHVQFVDRAYELRRGRSSVGKYVSPNAALIIDGRSAVFVADDRQLGTCMEAFPSETAVGGNLAGLGGTLVSLMGSNGSHVWHCGPLTSDARG